MIAVNDDDIIRNLMSCCFGKSRDRYSSKNVQILTYRILGNFAGSHCFKWREVLPKEE
ncbi:hypothetical protein BRADI_4g18833v3 [Brachypodium distachyon]|uniref:Uncharacterized protein n=1 Tax=Brachypodium distachyon TaxID=15368 RepID=A0A2K2CNM7_BRADI|nr:hypothetical protein BRADI_4g18833v3 [Brachypodium distachyon]